MSVEKDKSGIYMYYEDPAGNTIRLFDYHGYPLPKCPGDQVTRMKQWNDFKSRHDDVFICGYTKSGTNWVWEITNMLLSSNTENLKTNKMSMMLEIQDQGDLDALPSPRVLNAHPVPGLLPPDIFAKKCKILYLLRNPKDVAVSAFYHHRNIFECYQYEGDWANYFQLFMDGKVDYGSWFTYVRDWEKFLKAHTELPIHVIHYEQMKLNFIGETKKLADFLGVRRDDAFFRRVAEKCHFKNMKAVKQTTFTTEERGTWRDGNVLFFRKGIIGDWKSHFTVDQNERFDAAIRERLKGSDLKFTYQS